MSVATFFIFYLLFNLEKKAIHLHLSLHITLGMNKKKVLHKKWQQHQGYKSCLFIRWRSENGFLNLGLPISFLFILVFISHISLTLYRVINKGIFFFKLHPKIHQVTRRNKSILRFYLLLIHISYPMSSFYIHGWGAILHTICTL